MKVLAVTCYTGDEELVDMTRECLWSLRDCEPVGVELQMSSTAQGAFRTIEDQGSWVDMPTNIGFAFGMNAAIETGVNHYGEPDHVLCFNNDLQFPYKNWLGELTDIAGAILPFDQVLVPATDRTAIRIQPGPLDKASFPVQENSAYCWLVPFAWCQFLKETYGFWLFSEDFAPAYGEDNWTAFLLSKKFGSKAFRYVPRSFVKHLRGRTARTVKHDRKKSNRVLVDKLNVELKDPSLRSDLRKWGQHLIRVLSKRL